MHGHTNIKLTSKLKKKNTAQLPSRSYYNEFINSNNELFFKDNEMHMIKIKRG